MPNPAISLAPPKQRDALLERERKFRRTGQWGEWETLTFPLGTIGQGWSFFITTAHRNRVFSVLDRIAECGVRHLAVSSLTGTRPTWPDMQRINNELAGADATAIEVYPPQDQVVDDADMFHIWVLRGKLPFGLHTAGINPALFALRQDDR